MNGTKEFQEKLAEMLPQTNQSVRVTLDFIDGPTHSHHAANLRMLVATLRVMCKREDDLLVSGNFDDWVESLDVISNEIFMNAEYTSNV
jgi:hypothetical protein